MAWNLFQLDPNMSPQQVDTRRLLIANMLNQGRQADSVGEGLVALAGGIVGGINNRNLDKLETTNRQKAEEQFRAAMGGWSPFAMGGAGSDTLAGSAGGDALGSYADAIAGNESGGNYQAVGPTVKNGDRAYGKYQVMGANVGPWTEKYVGRRMTPQEFMADPAAQDAVFNGEFGSYVQKYGNPQDAASMWFSGRPMAQAGNASDGYMTVPDYVSKFTGQLDGQVAGGAGSDGLTGQSGSDMLGGNTTAIYQALANPWLTQDQRQMLMMMLEQNDPLRQMQLREAQLRVQQMENPAPEAAPAGIQELQFRAQAAGLQPGTPEYQQFMLGGGKMPGGADGVTYGVTPQLFTDDTGQTRMGVLGSDGSFKPVELPPGAVLTKGYEKVDLGNQWAIVNTNTGEVISTIGKNVAEEAAAKAEGAKTGEAAADAQLSLPTVLAQGEQALSLIHSIMTDPALPGITGMIQGRIPPMSQGGTDLAVKIDQLKGKTFLEAFASLKGGGAITEREGQAAQEAIARLNRAQSTDAYLKALDELSQIIALGMARAKAKAGVVAPTAAPDAPAQGNVMRFDENGNLIQ